MAWARIRSSTGALGSAFCLSVYPRPETRACGWQRKTATILPTCSVKDGKIPVDEWRLAENAFCLEKSEKRYLPPIQRIAESLPISSREPTPAQEQPMTTTHEYNFTHRLQIAFDKAPRDPTKRYSFGTNSQNCVILLGSKSAHRVSGLHFCITFDDTIDHKKHLILRNSSANGTVVS